MSEALAFDAIWLAGRSSAGRLKLAPGGLGWKEGASGEVTTIRADELRRPQWLRAARDHELRFLLANGSLVRFSGFPGDARAKLAPFVRSHYGLDLEDREYSLKGWNWGQTAIVEADRRLEFRVGTRTAFEIPFSSLGAVSVPAKNELAIEMGTAPGEDELVEMRIHVPGQGMANEAEPVDAAAVLCEQIRTAAGLDGGADKGRVMATVPDVHCLVPRGRFGLDIGSTHLRLHGKSQDYRIAHTAITKLFVLPKSDSVHVYMVMSLDPPLKHGQTRYPHLVLQFTSEESLTVATTGSEDPQWTGRLEAQYEGSAVKVVGELLRAVTGQRLVVPGSFRSHRGAFCVRCSLKANEGSLYLLEKNLVFLVKPPLLIPHTAIGEVGLGRTGGSSAMNTNNRTFDLRVVLNTGRGASAEHLFSNIPKEELSVVEAFLRAKEVVVRHEAAEDVRMAVEEEDSEDEDFVDDGADAKRARTGEDAEESSTDEDYQEDGSDVEGDDA